MPLMCATDDNRGRRVIPQTIQWDARPQQAAYSQSRRNLDTRHAGNSRAEKGRGHKSSVRSYLGYLGALETKAYVPAVTLPTDPCIH